MESPVTTATIAERTQEIDSTRASPRKVPKSELGTTGIEGGEELASSSDSPFSFLSVAVTLRTPPRGTYWTTRGSKVTGESSIFSVEPSVFPADSFFAAASLVSAAASSTLCVVPLERSQLFLNMSLNFQQKVR